MTEDLKKKIVAFVSIIIGLGILTIFLTSIVNKKKEENELKNFNNDEKFYAIQSTINTTIDDQYKNYTIKKLVYKTHNNTDYCFVNGYILNFPPIGEVTFQDNVNYLLILKGNTYNLSKIETTNIDEFAKNYTEYKELTGENVLDMIYYTEKNKLASYVANYLNLSIFDTSASYKLLSSKERSKYGSEYNYKKNIEKYRSLSTNIDSYKKEDNTYTVTDSNKTTFKIIEYSTMNYEIEL
jgi:hypothetical protein